MEEMKVKRAARKQECENQTIMQKSAVGSSNATMPRQSLQDESLSQPTQVVHPPVQDVPDDNPSQSIPQREAQQNIQTPSTKAVRKPPVNASHGPLGQAALPIQFGSFTGLPPKAPEVPQSSSRPASTASSVPGTPRSRLARIRELQAQRGLTPTFKADESKGICVVSDEHYTMAARPVELDSKIAGIASRDSPGLTSNARSEPAEEPEPPAVAVVRSRSATPCGDDKIKSLRIEKVVMVNDHYGDDGLFPGTFSGSPAAKVAPKIAEAEGESYDGVLQDLKLKWTRYSVAPKQACHKTFTKRQKKEEATEQDSDAAEPMQINFQLTPCHADPIMSDNLQLSMPSAPVSPKPSAPLSPLSTLKTLRGLDQASEVEAVWREAEDPVSSPKKRSPRKGGHTPKDNVVPLPPLDSGPCPLSKTLGCPGGAEFLASRGKRDDCAQM